MLPNTNRNSCEPKGLQHTNKPRFTYQNTSKSPGIETDTAGISDMECGELQYTGRRTSP